MNNSPDLKKITVFLVDDDRAMVASTGQWLSLSGLAVQSFARAPDLIRHLKPSIPAIIISDIKMPEMDGMELMNWVLAKDPDIPVILITGHGDVPLAVKAMKAGAFEFLTKPFSPEELLHVAQQAIARRAAQLAQPEADQMVVSALAATSVLQREDGDANGLAERVDTYERDVIVDALARHEGNISAVMQELDLPRRTLNAKMKKYGIHRKPR